MRGAVWKLTARISSLFIQSFYFLIISRALGTEQYGLFIGVMAFVKLLVPFSSWGMPHILLKCVSRDRNVFNVYWGNTICVTLVLGTVTLLGILLTNSLILSASFPWQLLLLIGLAELIFARIHDAVIKALIATDNFQLDAQFNILLSLNGLIAAICLLVFFREASAAAWGILYLESRLVTALAGLFVIHRFFGKPRLDLSLLRPEVVQGFFFSVSLSSQTVYNDVDKIMLASMSTLSATGIYGAAYRIIEVAMIPVISLLGASYAQFFRHGAKGIQGSLAFAKKIVPFSAGYGLIASLGVCAFASFIPTILGEEYRDAVGALRWLSPLIFFKALQFFAADTLTGAGLQGVRTILQAAFAGSNALMNFWLIPLYSWKGAAISSLITDGVLVLALWALIFYYSKKSHAYNADS